jgi:glutathione S-transferase
MILHHLDVLSSCLSSQARLWRGALSYRPVKNQPEQPLELYEFEASPYCRLVREALTELDLDVVIYPCPQGGQRFRPVMQALGGKQQFPFLIDPNTGKQLYESLDILDYLSETYGRKVRTARGALRPVAIGAALASTLLRGRLKGYKARPSRAPAQPLILYSFEASPYARLVREALCELEIPYLLRQFGKAQWQDIGTHWTREKLFPGLPVKGRHRTALKAKTGKMQVPYLIDPNTGVEMFESAKILAYLQKTYAL